MSLTGNSATDLGLGGALSQQVEGETEEQRRKRMQQQQLSQSLGAANSLAVTSLFGARGGPGGAQ